MTSTKEVTWPRVGTTANSQKAADPSVQHGWTMVFKRYSFKNTENTKKVLYLIKLKKSIDNNSFSLIVTNFWEKNNHDFLHFRFSFFLFFVS